MGSRAEFTKVLGLVGYRVAAVEWDEPEPAAPRLRLRMERRGPPGLSMQRLRRPDVAGA
jgi:hypothetical protein